MSAIHIAALKRVSEYNGRLEVRVAELEETLSRYQSGHHGGCMTIEELAQQCHDRADEMASLLVQIDDCGEEYEFESLIREGVELARKWHGFSQSKEVLEAGE